MLKGTRPRRSADETRRVLVEEGVRQLERHGVEPGIDHLTLESACVATDVPRSSSHAAWSIDENHAPQSMYQRTVLREWLSAREGLLFSTGAATALAKALEERHDTITRAEVIRIAIQGALEAAVVPDEQGRGSGFLATDMAIKHALASQPHEERDGEVLGWARRAEIDNRAARIDDSYRPLAEMLDMRPRPEFGDAAFDHLALAVASLVEGISMRELLLPELEVARKPIVATPQHEAAATLLGVCVEALVDRFLEPVSGDGVTVNL